MAEEAGKQYIVAAWKLDSLIHSGVVIAALKCVREDWSFTPLGLIRFRTFTHGSRRGLHFYAASRLTTWGFVSGVVEILVLTYALKRCATQRSEQAWALG
jgi:hypothetical protein